MQPLKERTVTKPIWPTVLGIAAGLVLVLAIGFLLASTGGRDPAGPGTATTATAPPGADPTAGSVSVAARYLAAWRDADWAAMESLLAAPVPAFRVVHDVFLEDLEAELRELTVGTVPTSTDFGVLVPFSVTLAVADAGLWTYASELPLVEADGEWRVSWTPAILHPALDAGERLVTRVVEEPRAPIVDATGRPLTSRDTVIVVGVIPGRISSLDETAAAIEAELGVAADEVRAEVQRPGVQSDWFVPLADVRKEHYATVRAALFPVPGVAFRRAERRLTSHPGLAPHILGSVGPITAELLDELGPPYDATAEVGRSGLERAFETTLAGSPTTEIVELDRSGAEVAVVHRFEGKVAEPLETTLDLDVQLAVEHALAGIAAPASMVVLDASTAAILGAASVPTDEFNRAFAARYPPGSTFKIVAAAALLMDGLSPDDLVDCPASVTVGGKSFANASGDLGTITLGRAFAASCNTAFISQVTRRPPAALAAAATAFGFGSDYELPLASSGGSYPDPSDAAELGAAAIGQGRVLTSPLHMAAVAAAVASGSWKRPHLLPGEEPPAAPIDATVIRGLRTMMREVVTSGTGTAAQFPGIDVYGKTGTAEVADGTVAWFVGFAGDLAFAVAVEGEGSGGAVAAPLVTQFLHELSNRPVVPAGDCAPADAAWAAFQGGPTRVGCSEAPPVTTPQIAWRSRVGIQGWLNGPVTNGDLIFVGSAGRERGAPDGFDGIYAIDASTGERRWQVAAAEDVNGVAYADGVLYATSDDGLVRAIDAATSAVRWIHRADAPVFTHPLVVEGLVVVGAADGTLLALDTASGSVAWTASLDGAIRGGASSDGTIVYAVGEAGDARAFALDGTLLWKTRLDFTTDTGETLTARVFGAPTIAGDLVVIPHLRTGPQADPALIALDRYLGDVVWTGSDPAGLEPAHGNLRTSPAVAGSLLVYANSGTNSIVAVDTATGEVRWAVGSGQSCGTQWASPIVVGGLVVAPRPDGSVHAVDAETGTTMWTLRLGNVGPSPCSDPASRPIEASPAVLPDGSIVVGSLDEFLYRIAPAP